MAPLTRDPNGRVVLRPFLSGLAKIPPRPGLLAVILVALGSTTFDGFSRTGAWITWTAASEVSRGPRSRRRASSP